MDQRGRMKILFVQKMAGISGSEQYYLQMLPELRRRGHLCKFLCVFQKGSEAKNIEFCRRLSDSGIEVILVPYRFHLSPLLVRRIGKVIEQGRFDLVQSNLVHADFWCALAKRFLVPDARLISMVHGHDGGTVSFQQNPGFDLRFSKRDLFYGLSKLSAAYADHVIAISKGLGDFLVKAGIVPAAKMQVIPYGADFSAAEYGPEGRFRRSGRQLVIVGRLVPYKGHSYVLGIMKDLLSEFPDVSLVIVGAGTMKAALQKTARRLGISDHVHFEGFQLNVHNYFRDSDVAIVPSVCEGFGMTALEAWHNKLPVVAFDVPALNEIIVDGVNGYLVPPFDSDILRERVARLLINPALREEMGSRGHTRLKEVYSIARMADATLSAYQEVLTSARVASHDR